MRWEWTFSIQLRPGQSKMKIAIIRVNQSKTLSPVGEWCKFTRSNHTNIIATGIIISSLQKFDDIQDFTGNDSPNPYVPIWEYEGWHELQKMVNVHGPPGS
jgi:hypothetical protein